MTDPQESEEKETKIWDVLFGAKENDKETFISWIKNVFEGRFAF